VISFLSDEPAPRNHPTYRYVQVVESVEVVNSRGQKSEVGDQRADDRGQTTDEGWHQLIAHSSKGIVN